jgi:competence protein ComEC
VLCAWYGGLLAIALARRNWRRWVAFCALVVAASLTVRALAPRWSHELRATFLDVGQGDACVIELPGGHAAVIDGGGSFDAAFDPGEQVIAPFLWRRGIRRLDVVILSHPHPDHANGLAFLVEHFPVGEVWTNGAETAQPGTVRLLQVAARRGVPIGAPRSIDLGGARLRPLAPLDAAGRIAVDAARSENDNSLVIQLDYRGHKLLFPGDLEAEGEAALVDAAGAGLASDVLKVPHHGSRTSSTDTLLDAVRPHVAVFSVGERNRWGFPHPTVLARYAARGVRALRTDRDGAVTVAVSGRGALTVESYR